MHPSEALLGLMEDRGESGIMSSLYTLTFLFLGAGSKAPCTRMPLPGTTALTQHSRGQPNELCGPCYGAKHGPSRSKYLHL